MYLKLFRLFAGASGRCCPQLWTNLVRGHGDQRYTPPSVGGGQGRLPVSAGCSRLKVPDRSHCFEAVHIGHLEVHQHEIEALAREGVQRRVPGLGHHDGMALPLPAAGPRASGSPGGPPPVACAGDHVAPGARDA